MSAHTSRYQRATARSGLTAICRTVPVNVYSVTAVSPYLSPPFRVRVNIPSIRDSRSRSPVISDCRTRSDCRSLSEASTRPHRVPLTNIDVATDNTKVITPMIAIIAVSLNMPAYLARHFLTHFGTCLGQYALPSFPWNHPSFVARMFPHLPLGCWALQLGSAQRTGWLAAWLM